MWTRFLPTLLVLSSFNAQAWIIQSNDNTREWLLQQQPKTSVYQEMNKYFTENDPKTDAKPYIKSFISNVHQSLVTEADNSLAHKLNEPSCKSATKISYPKSLTSQYNFKSKVNFEKEIIKIQSYDCLGQLNVHRVFDVLMSPDFQKDAVDGMKAASADQKNNRVCQRISLFPFGTSSVCFTQNVLLKGNQYVIHSFNEENINNPSAIAYYRDSITVITQLKNGEVSIYNLGYARGPDLPFHSVVESVIKKQQKTLIEKLIQQAR